MKLSLCRTRGGKRRVGYDCIKCSASIRWTRCPLDHHHNMCAKRDLSEPDGRPTLKHMASRGDPDQDPTGEIRGKRGSTSCDCGAPRGRIETLRSRSNGTNEREIVGPSRRIMTHLTHAIVDVYLTVFRSNGQLFSGRISL